MLDLTPKLKLKQPHGNESVSRASYNENLALIDQNAASQAQVNEPFDLKAAVYDPLNNRLDLTLGPGRAAFLGIMVAKQEDTAYSIVSPTINTSYFIYLKNDGSFTHNSNGSEITGAVTIWKIFTGEPVSKITTEDLRGRLPGVAARMVQDNLNSHLNHSDPHSQYVKYTDFTIYQDIMAESYPDGLLPENGKKFGGKFTSGPGMSLSVSPFRAVIGSKIHRMDSTTSLNLAPLKTSLVYAQKQPAAGNLIPVLGKTDAIYPAADSNTVLRYTFSETGNPLDSSGNMNHGVIHGNVFRVDGWTDYARQGDGSTGYIESTNYAKFPLGAEERELDILYTPLCTTVLQSLVMYGGVNDSWFYIAMEGTRLYYGYTNNHINHDTGFDLEMGKTYLINLCYNGKKGFMYVNGVFKHLFNAVLTTIPTPMTILRDYYAGGCNYTKGIIHYLELRNKIRSPYEIAKISNQLCLPVNYKSYSCSYPPNDPTPGAHIWKFDEMSGNVVADESGTMNGSAVGTIIVPSELGIGKARKFNGTSDYIGLGSYAFPRQFSVIAVINSDHGPSDEFVILGNRTSGDTAGLNISILTNKFRINTLQTNGLNAGETNNVPSGVPVFLALTNNNDDITFYLNSPFPCNRKQFALDYSAQSLVIGKKGSQNSGYFRGTIEYLAIIPSCLTQADIMQYYKTLIQQTEKSIVDDLLPADSISLGLVRTGSSRIIETDDVSTKYLRNELRIL